MPTPTQTAKQTVHTDSPQTKGTVDIQPTRTDTTETVPTQNHRATFPTPKPGLILTRSGMVSKPVVRLDL